MRVSLFLLFIFFLNLKSNWFAQFMLLSTTYHQSLVFSSSRGFNKITKDLNSLSGVEGADCSEIEKILFLTNRYLIEKISKNSGLSLAEVREVVCKSLELVSKTYFSNLDSFKPSDFSKYFQVYRNFLLAIKLFDKKFKQYPEQKFKKFMQKWFQDSSYFFIHTVSSNSLKSLGLDLNSCLSCYCVVEFCKSEKIVIRNFSKADDSDFVQFWQIIFYYFFTLKMVKECQLRNDTYVIDFLSKLELKFQHVFNDGGIESLQLDEHLLSRVFCCCKFQEFSMLSVCPFDCKDFQNNSIAKFIPAQSNIFKKNI